MKNNRGSSYILIQDWMVDELNLKGNELLIYAIIHGFSQDGETHFTGSLRYLMKWTNSSKTNTIKVLKSLTEKGLIQKADRIINGVHFCEYWSTKFTEGGQQSLPNNLLNNIDNNLNDRKDIPPEKNKPAKHKYGEYDNVLLSDEDLAKLQNEFPNDWQQRIEKLSSYIESTGKKYKNHLATIRNWNRMDKERNPKKNNMPNYDDESGSRFQRFM